MYAAYLYDAVKLYAEALDEVLKEGGNFKNGTRVIEKVIGRAYKSKFPNTYSIFVPGLSRHLWSPV